MRSTSLADLEKFREDYRKAMKAKVDKRNKKIKRCTSMLPFILLAIVGITYISNTYLFEIKNYDLSSVKLKGLRGDIVSKLVVSSVLSQEKQSLGNSAMERILPVVIVTSNNTAPSHTSIINSTKLSAHIPTSGSFYSKDELSGRSSYTNKIEKSLSETTIPLPVLANNKLTIPELNHLQDTTEPISPSDHAVFLHMPKTGGTTTKNVLGVCHRKVLASEAGIKGHEGDKEIAVIKGYGDSLFVNIDPTTPEGIQRGYDLGFADAHLADLTVTPKLYAIDDLFKPESKGRIISMFRHPIERAVSMVNYLKYAEWEPSYVDEFKTMTLEEYTKSPYVENNFYTRILSNTMEGELTDDHFKIAIYNLRRKVFVGLLHKLDESIDRFEKLFSWNYNYNPSEQEKCRQGYLEKGANVGKAKYIDVPAEGTEGYELLAWQNQYDLKLYDIVLKIFEEQNSLVAGKPLDYRLVDTTCSLCEEKKEKRTHAEEEQAKITFNLDADNVRPNI